MLHLTQGLSLGLDIPSTPSPNTALVVYEYVITFGREVELYWRHKISGAVVLFYCTRYSSLLANVYGLLGAIPVSNSVRLTSPTPFLLYF